MSHAALQESPVAAARNWHHRVSLELKVQRAWPQNWGFLANNGDGMHSHSSPSSPHSGQGNFSTLSISPDSPSSVSDANSFASLPNSPCAASAAVAAAAAEREMCLDHLLHGTAYEQAAVKSVISVNQRDEFRQEAEATRSDSLHAFMHAQLARAGQGRALPQTEFKRAATTSQEVGWRAVKTLERFGPLPLILR